jgi:excinuclease ABC subunit C
MQVSEHIKNILKTLPNNPGVYQHLDKDGTIIYVGKAKDLRSRVRSYFNKNQDNAKTRILVRRIADIRIIVTPTEIEALLLENNLIKKHQPRYNIMLKDDKGYPWIVIRKERFPRIYALRNPVKDGSEFFGPYANYKVMKTVLDLIKHLFTLRSCTLNLSEENINGRKHKVCLEYHLGNCKGPCENYQTEENYNKDVAEARDILKGNITLVKQILTDQMKAQAAELAFEEAQKTKEKIELLERYQAKSTVVNTSITNVDVFSVFTDAQYGYVNYLKIIEGMVIQAHTVEIKKKLDESEAEILEVAIPEIRSLFHSQSKEIYTSHAVDMALENVHFSVPQRGDKMRLIELSLRNARFHRSERMKNIQIVDPDRHANRIMEQMKSDLRMPVEPRHIECFDNSNIQGTNPVAACVVFKNGKPSKKDYRNFNIETVVGPDDFASMEEVILRRYSRLLREGEPLPQLIIVDGGKGQLSAALKSLDILGLRGKISIIGIAKRLEEIYFPGDSVPLYLDKRSETLKVIQQARNEAHRFGITHHRKRRNKSGIKSELENIQGIGPATIKELLKQFKSVKGVRNASAKELEDLLGLAKARKILAYFEPKEK